MTERRDRQAGAPSAEQLTYPPYVRTPEEMEQWDLSRGIAQAAFGDQGPAAVWSATRAIFNGSLPTHDA